VTAAGAANAARTWTEEWRAVQNVMLTRNHSLSSLQAKPAALQNLDCRTAHAWFDHDTIIKPAYIMCNPSKFWFLMFAYESTRREYMTTHGIYSAAIDCLKYE
jgi:hypothetical protein